MQLVYFNGNRNRSQSAGARCPRSMLGSGKEPGVLSDKSVPLGHVLNTYDQWGDNTGKIELALHGLSPSSQGVLRSLRFTKSY